MKALTLIQASDDAIFLSFTDESRSKMGSVFGKDSKGPANKSNNTPVKVKSNVTEKVVSKSIFILHRQGIYDD